MKHSPSLEKKAETFAKKEWKQLLRIRDDNHLIFLGLLIVLTCLLVLGGIAVINHSLVRVTGGVTELLPSRDKVLTSTQEGKTTAFTVSISSVTETDKPDPAFTLAAGQTLLMLNISLTNKTDQVQDVIPVNQLFVRSRTGYYASMHPSTFITKPLVAGTVEPGATVTGQVSFSVPKQLAQPLLYVDPGWANQSPVVFDVLR